MGCKFSPQSDDKMTVNVNIISVDIQGVVVVAGML